MVNAYYKFDIYRDNSVRYKIRRSQKVGNHPLLNKFFEYHDKLWIHKITPSSIAEYVGYVVGSNVGVISWLPMVFESSTLSPESGIFKGKDLQEVVLFKLNHDKSIVTFEVFVFKVAHELSLLMLQAMNDGRLDIELEAIKSKCIQ